MVYRNVSSDGFTLLEVVVSIAILGISLGIIMNIISDGLNLTNRTRMEMSGISLAQPLLASAGVERPLRNEDVSGEFAGGFHWRLQVEPYGKQEDRDNWPIQAYSLTATISWTERGSDQAVKLSSLRLAPKENWP